MDVSHLFFFFRFISILPSLHLSIIVDPNEAISLRHPRENAGKTPQQIKQEIEQISQEQSSEAKRVESDVLPDDSIKGILESLPNYVYDSDHLRKLYDPEELRKLYPKSQKELVLTILLVLFSAICLSYFALALYHCICPKNYARWRSRWYRGQHKKRESSGGYYKQIKESLPKVLKGHVQVKGEIGHNFFCFYHFVHSWVLIFLKSELSMNSVLIYTCIVYPSIHILWFDSVGDRVCGHWQSVHCQRLPRGSAQGVGLCHRGLCHCGPQERVSTLKGWVQLIFSTYEIRTFCNQWCCCNTIWNLSNEAICV